MYVQVVKTIYNCLSKYLILTIYGHALRIAIDVGYSKTVCQDFGIDFGFHLHFEV